MPSRWASSQRRRYRCDRCRRFFVRTIIVDPLTDWRDKVDPHFCGRKDCYPPHSPGLFDNLEPLNAATPKTTGKDA